MGALDQVVGAALGEVAGGLVVGGAEGAFDQVFGGFVGSDGADVALFGAEGFEEHFDLWAGDDLAVDQGAGQEGALEGEVCGASMLEQGAQLVDGDQVAGLEQVTELDVQGPGPVRRHGAECRIGSPRLGSGAMRFVSGNFAAPGSV